MADLVPLSEEERAELEELRAEKAAREEAARIAQERAELNRLKAQRAATQREAQEMAHEAELRERGRRLMEPDEDDLSMPLGQKIVLIVVAALALVVIAAQFILR